MFAHLLHVGFEVRKNLGEKTVLYFNKVQKFSFALRQMLADLLGILNGSVKVEVAVENSASEVPLVALNASLWEYLTFSRFWTSFSMKTIDKS